jgi:hypothetical protein
MFFALSLIMSAMRVEEQLEEQQQVSTVGNENDGDESNELKKENISLKVFRLFKQFSFNNSVDFYQAKVQVLEAGNIQYVKV